MSNLELWDKLSRTDPAHTKGFSRAGGFKGTAIKPIWIVKRLTEQFGPVGRGWGMSKPHFDVVQAGDETLVYCTVECWAGTPNNSFWGVGGDKVTAKRRDGSFNDDEAFKKAFTDAVGNAFKFLGVGADIHMGLFDDSKYVREVAADFAREGEGHSQRGAVSPPPTSPHTGEPVHDGKAKRGLEGPYTSKAKLFAAFTALQSDVVRCGDSDTLDVLLASDEAKAVIAQCERDAPHYLHGGDPAPDDFEPLFARIQRMRDVFQLENA